MNDMRRAGGSGSPEGADGLEVVVDDKTYAGADGNPVQAVKGLRFRCPAASCTALVGPSGCGKTTVLRIIAGLDRDFTGKVTFAGRPASRARIGFIFQEPTLLPWRSVDDNIRLAAPEIGERVLTELLRQAELLEFRKRFPAELSLGLARRVSIVRALASGPDLLLLDEPFVSLDAETSANLRALVATMLDERPITAILVTHDIREAVELADRIITLTARPARVKSSRTIETPRAKRSAAAIKRISAEIEKTRSKRRR